MFSRPAAVRAAAALAASSFAVAAASLLFGAASAATAAAAPVAVQSASGGSAAGHPSASDRRAVSTDATLTSADVSPSLGPSLAVEPPPPVTGSQTRWSVQPATASGPDARSLFDYLNVRPGIVLHDHVAVTNESEHTVRFQVYASDAHTTATGGYDLLPQVSKPTDVGSWIVLGAKSLTLQAHTRAIVGFILKVPARATPGDHSGGIVAQVTSAGSAGSGSPVAVTDRLGVRVYVRVAGTITPAVSIESLHASYGGSVNPAGGGSGVIDFTIRNTGNVRVSGTVSASLSSWYGAIGTAHDSIGLLLPGDSLTLHARIPRAYPGGPLHARVTVTPHDDTADTGPVAVARAAERSATVWAWPWPQLAALIVLAGLVLLGRWLLAWWRARIRAQLAAAEERGRLQAATSLPAAEDPAHRTPRAVSTPDTASAGSPE